MRKLVTMDDDDKGYTDWAWRIIGQDVLAAIDTKIREAQKDALRNPPAAGAPVPAR